MPLVAGRLAEDLRECVKVLRLTHEADGYPMNWPADPENWIAPQRELSAWVARDSSGGITGHVGLHSVGNQHAAGLWSGAAGLTVEHIGAVSRLFVAPEARRQGIGSALLTAATERAAVLGLWPALDVVEHNGSAIRLYEDASWRRVGEYLWETGERARVFAYLAPRPGGAGTDARLG